MAKATKPVIIITGVSSGIGLASAKLFAEKGWIVVGSIRGKKRPDELETAAIDVQTADMTRPRDLAKLVEGAIDTYGRIDAVLANAGYGLFGPLEVLSYGQMVDQLLVNSVAPAELARLVLPVMRRQGSGVIAAVSSVAGRAGFPDHSVYAASKFALEGFLESLWYEVEADGIAVKLIEPSRVKTPFWDNLVLPAGRQPRTTSQSLWSRWSRRQHLTAEMVADACYKAITSPTPQLHYGVGLTSALVLAKHVLPDRTFRRALKRLYISHK